MIYMIMPAYFKTGGTELGHQFVNACVKLGYEAKVAYVNSPNDGGGGRST